ncbi:hypothetical protein CLOM_g16709 [Closterium sp. NIES-68]|nr:hypothetical protein CLOM_g16709 [Closterium sp. NIES-68]GJP82832.1 hypothetical protein CLOP_g13059 [Closterium sp. NIES-67]
MSIAAASARRHVRWQAMLQQSQLIAQGSFFRRPVLDRSFLTSLDRLHDHAVHTAPSPSPHSPISPPFSPPHTPLASATATGATLLPCALAPSALTLLPLQGRLAPAYDAARLKDRRSRDSAAHVISTVAAGRMMPGRQPSPASWQVFPQLARALQGVSLRVGAARLASGRSEGEAARSSAEGAREVEGEGKAREGGEDAGKGDAGGSEESEHGGRSSSGGSSGGRGLRSGPVTWASLALLLLTGGALLTYFESEKRKRLEAVHELKPVGKAAIGGPFALVDDKGRPFTEAALKGKWSLLYFGFTFCPDICPSELIKIAEAVNLVEKQVGVAVVPVFISVDPERDTVEQVREYVKEFHPRMVGLTGTPEQVKAAARAFRVYYMKTEEEGYDYLVDHSIISYLMSPEFEFVKFFGRNHTAEGLADGIAGEIKSHGK